jgi:hypothetical protein
MDLLLSVLPADGAWMEFSAFVAAVRVAGGQPSLWKRAKASGLVETEVVGDYAETGVLNIRKVV